MNTPAERQAILETSRNQADLEKTALYLAASSHADDLKMLETFLTRGANLRRLDTVSDPAVKTKRFSAVVATLGRNAAPEAGTVLHALFASKEVSEDGERVLRLLAAAAAIKPMTPERLELFRTEPPATYLLTGLNLLITNTSPPALAEAKREILAKPETISDVTIVSVMHNTVVPNRTNADVIVWGQAMAREKLSDAMEVGLYESFFDYRYEAWYRTKKSPPDPPKWESASRHALEELLRLAEQSKSAPLPEPLHRKIAEEEPAIRAALTQKPAHP